MEVVTLLLFLSSIVAQRAEAVVPDQPIRSLAKSDLSAFETWLKDPNGKPMRYSSRQFWWSKHQPFFKERLDTRERDDIASTTGEWTRVECVCRDDRVSVFINGVKVNEACNVFPHGSRILLQNEAHEIYFRKLVISPLKDTK